MLETLAEAFRRLAIVIAADWSAPPFGEQHPSWSSMSLQKDTTPEEIIEAFVRNAQWQECIGLMGFIHPVWTAKPMLMGHWGF